MFQPGHLKINHHIFIVLSAILIRFYS